MEQFTFPQKDNNEEADPNTFSPLSSSMELEGKTEKRGDSVIDKNTGAEYFSINNARHEGNQREIKGIEVELFVSLLSKGILHVSDVVEKDGNFYSKKMPLENIKPGEKMELEAENFLLHYIFSDWDHKTMTGIHPESSLKDENGLRYHHNLIEDERGAFAHFDYDVALGNQMDVINGTYMFIPNDEKLHSGTPLKKLVTIDEIERQANLHDQPILKKLKGFFTGKNTDQLIKVLNEKTELFMERINDEYFFEAVLKKSKLDITLPQFNFLNGNNEKEKEESLRNYFKEKLELLKSVIG